MKSVNALLSLLGVFPSVHAWGATGHEAVAYVAQSFLTASASSWAENILSDTSADYLANVATWADSYRYTSAGKWSAPLHYIDARDDPPHSCGVDFNRDCGSNGCIVAAITNYTKMVQDTSADRLSALKFLVHFIGDIHQPLHDENLDVGGNTIDVTYGTTSTNLHAVWDTYMIGADAGAASLATAKELGAKLTAAIKTGAYQSQAPSWTKGLCLSDPQATALSWAQDANSYVCSTVMPNGVDVLSGADLSGDYYTNAIPIVEELLARAGYRLGAWLNLLAGASKDQ